MLTATSPNTVRPATCQCSSSLGWMAPAKESSGRCKFSDSQHHYQVTAASERGFGWMRTRRGSPIFTGSAIGGS